MRVVYLGELDGGGDRWLHDLLAKAIATTVIHVPPDLGGGREIPPADIILNRLYTTAIERYAPEKVALAAELLLEAEGRRRIINSARGYRIDCDRVLHVEHFGRFGLDYIKTTPVLSPAFHALEPGAYVVKGRRSGRNQRLKIITGPADLLAVEQDALERLVVQPLITQHICHRTEFVGSYDVTYVQRVSFGADLSFERLPGIVPSPLNDPTHEALTCAMADIGVSAFAVEYFLVDGGMPMFVDFGLTSNYPDFLLSNAGAHMGDAWTRLLR